jgi:hypothetical protein
MEAAISILARPPKCQKKLDRKGKEKTRRLRDKFFDHCKAASAGRVSGLVNRTVSGAAVGGIQFCSALTH